MNKLKDILKKNTDNLEYHFIRGEGIDPEIFEIKEKSRKTLEMYQNYKSRSSVQIIAENNHSYRVIKRLARSQYNSEYGFIHTHIYPDGSIYKGKIIDGKKNGKGTLICFEEPEWLAADNSSIGLYNRYGDILTESNIKCEPKTTSHIIGYKKKPKKKIHFEGEWKDNEFHGKGIYTKNITNNLREHYNGEWVNGKKHGTGNFECGDEKYNGKWYEGKKHGYGINIWRNGDKYHGNWINGKKDGLGDFSYSNGDKYSGEFHFDNRHGEGTYIWSNGDIYKGYWDTSQRHGKGTFTKANNYKYEGEWKYDKPHGEGTCYYLNGNKYVGNWINGKKDGLGIYYGGCNNNYSVQSHYNKYNAEWTDNKVIKFGSVCKYNNPNYLSQLEKYVSKLESQLESQSNSQLNIKYNKLETEIENERNKNKPSRFKILRIEKKLIKLNETQFFKNKILLKKLKIKILELKEKREQLPRKSLELKPISQEQQEPVKPLEPSALPISQEQQEPVKPLEPSALPISQEQQEPVKPLEPSALPLSLKPSAPPIPPLPLELQVEDNKTEQQLYPEIPLCKYVEPSAPLLQQSQPPPPLASIVSPQQSKTCAKVCSQIGPRSRIYRRKRRKKKQLASRLFKPSDSHLQKINVFRLHHSSRPVPALPTSSPAPHNNCIICMNGNKTTIILPCEHLCFCNECSNTKARYIVNCPICKKKIEKLKRIYTN